MRYLLFILLLLLVGCSPTEPEDVIQVCNPNDFTSILLTDESGNELGWEGIEEDTLNWNYTEEFLDGQDSYIDVSIMPTIDFVLHKPYPNPFNVSTSISVSINLADSFNVYIINDECDSIKTIVDDFMSPGVYTFTWDATNDSNEVVNDGYYRIIASNGIVENYVHLKKESID